MKNNHEIAINTSLVLFYYWCYCLNLTVEFCETDLKWKSTFQGLTKHFYKNTEQSSNVTAT